MHHSLPSSRVAFAKLLEFSAALRSTRVDSGKSKTSRKCKHELLLFESVSLPRPCCSWSYIVSTALHVGLLSLL